MVQPICSMIKIQWFNRHFQWFNRNAWSFLGCWQPTGLKPTGSKPNRPSNAAVEHCDMSPRARPENGRPKAGKVRDCGVICLRERGRDYDKADIHTYQISNHDYDRLWHCDCQSINHEYHYYVIGVPVKSMITPHWWSPNWSPIIVPINLIIPKLSQQLLPQSNFPTKQWIQK